MLLTSLGENTPSRLSTLRFTRWLPKSDPRSKLDALYSSLLNDPFSKASALLHRCARNRTPMLVIPHSSVTFGEATERYFDQLWVHSKHVLALLLERTTGRLSYDDALPEAQQDHPLNAASRRN